jgi:erythromycin esterase-like protein
MTDAGRIAAVAHDGLDTIVEQAARARFVLIGDGTHGTDEFYGERAALTRRLIAEHGFDAVAVEADWPDAYRVNCYCRGASDDAGAEEALADFRRFPAWMWRNTRVLEFVDWLHDRQPDVGFYGLDLYSFHASAEAVIAYLDEIDPDAAARARTRYGCFDHSDDDGQAYGYATERGGAEGCEDEVVEQLLDLQRRAAEYAARDGRVAADRYFYAEQNARLVRNAEAYYRSMFRGRVSSWNLRDRHMAETLEALADHLSNGGGPARIVVWAHNSHLGDARATELGDAGELNLGQLVRERHARDTLLVGFTTYAGSVTAASDWGAAAERKRVRPALAGSFEHLFHATGLERFVLTTNDVADVLLRPQLERAIGVIYRPETERASHYFHARLAEQFDAVVHLDETHALQPLEHTSGWERGEAPETYPTAL